MKVKAYTGINIVTQSVILDICIGVYSFFYQKNKNCSLFITQYKSLVTFHKRSGVQKSIDTRKIKTIIYYVF